MSVVYVVQGHYTDEYGWEDLTESDDRQAALEDLRLYRESEPTEAHRMVRRTVKESNA